MENKQPETKFKAGGVTATIWNNTGVNSQGQPTSYYTISLERTYQDKEGNWKTTGSLRINDLPKARLALNKAYEYLVIKGGIQ